MPGLPPRGSPDAASGSTRLRERVCARSVRPSGTTGRCSATPRRPAPAPQSSQARPLVGSGSSGQLERTGANPANPVPLVQRPKAQRRRWRILTPAEVGAAERAFDPMVAEATEDRRAGLATARLLFLTMLGTGIRREEALGLRWRAGAARRPERPRPARRGDVGPEPGRPAGGAAVGRADQYQVRYQVDSLAPRGGGGAGRDPAPLLDAEGGNRTHTPRREPDFESGASANSATSAMG
jgi:hypothetical protein